MAGASERHDVELLPNGSVVGCRCSQLLCRLASCISSAASPCSGSQHNSPPVSRQRQRLTSSFTAMLYPHLRSRHNASQFVLVLSSATIDQVIYREDVPDAHVITGDAVLHMSGHSLSLPNYFPSA